MAMNSKGGIPVDPDGWVRDARMAKAINGYFTVAGKGVPNNPLNHESQRPGDQQWVIPYGDARRQAMGEGAALVPPTDPAAWMMADDPLPGADVLPYSPQPPNIALEQATRSYSTTAATPAPLGTNFSVGSTGRDTPKPGNASL
jgi:hypothetical protein